MTYDFLTARLAELIRINDCLNAGLAEITRDFAQGWQIESIPPGTEWAAIDRTTSGDYIRLIPARNLHALRCRLAQAELSQPREPGQPPAAGPAPTTGTQSSAAPQPDSGRHARVVIVRP